MKTRRTIYKYPVTLEDEFQVALPVDFEVLTVQTQLTRSPIAAFTTDEPFMWVLHTAETTKIVQVTFRLMGTGHILEGENWKYLGTFQLRGGALVFHLFVEEPHAIARRVVEERGTPGTKEE